MGIQAFLQPALESTGGPGTHTRLRAARMHRKQENRAQRLFSRVCSRLHLSYKFLSEVFSLFGTFFAPVIAFPKPIKVILKESTRFSPFASP